LKRTSRSRHGIGSLLVVAAGATVACTSASEPDSAAQTSSAVSSAPAACADVKEEDSTSLTRLGRTAADAQASAYDHAGMQAQKGCSRLAEAKCAAQPKCVAGAGKSTGGTFTTTGAAQETIDPATGGPITSHYTGSDLLTRTAPASWTPASTTPGNTGRAKPWSVDVTVKVTCTLECKPAPDGDGGAEASEAGPHEHKQEISSTDSEVKP